MERKMLLTLATALAAGIGLAGPAHAANTPADATITVTPIANVSLSLNQASFDLGSHEVGSSTVAAEGLVLTNNGQVSVTLDKRISNQSSPAGWVAGSAPGVDTYALFLATSAARMALGDFRDADHLLGAESNATGLKGAGGGSPILAVSGGGQSVNVWVKLAMPTSVSSQAQRNVTIRFTGTAQ